jgi:hypothetical protein
VRHQHQLTGADVLIERADDGGEVAGLVRRRVRIALRLVRAAPAEEIEAHHRPAPDQVWE